MSEQQPQPNLETAPAVSGEPSDSQTIIFMVVLSVVCAIILALLATALAEPKERAKDLDRSKQMMIAAHIMDYGGNFIIQDKEGKNIPAKYSDGKLVPGSYTDFPTSTQILDIYKKRLIPMLLTQDNKLVTMKEAGMDYEQYLVDFKKEGYYKQKYKLLYLILPNPTNGQEKSQDPIGYVIPVNGYGLWDAIYGYLAIKTDGDTVIGTTWYDQKETPGLGANISEEPWQSLFPNKKIFQQNPDGTTDFKTAPVGITVVKGKVNEVYGDSPKAKSAVDGMAGATLTGNGVTDAFRQVLSAYRSFLVSLAQKSQNGGGNDG